MKTSKRAHLKLVEEADDPAYREAVAIFRPLVEGKRGQTSRPKPPAPKPQKRATFFMMEHDLLTALGRDLNYPALVLASEIDRLVFTTGKNPVRLTTAIVHRLGLSRSRLTNKPRGEGMGLQARRIGKATTDERRCPVAVTAAARGLSWPGKTSMEGGSDPGMSQRWLRRISCGLASAPQPLRYLEAQC
jgi:hypothetical protein